MIQSYSIQQIDGLVSHNPMQITNGSLWIQASNIPMYFTASSVDYDRIAPWRWRIYTDRILTTMLCPEDEIEKAVDLAYFLSGREKTEKLTFRDENPLNVSKGNISGVHKKGSPSIITIHGRFATLHLNNQINVKFDSKHVNLVSRYTWYSTIHNYSGTAKPIIRASGHNRMKFHRLILGLHSGDRFPKVIHKNGDFLDCRESNLTVYNGQPLRRWNKS